MEKEKLSQLTKLFSPKSLAVVGAAREPGKLGNIVVKNIIDGGYRGEVFPINPNADLIYNLKCFHNYKELPRIPDLAIITLPADATLTVLPEIGEFGTKQILILGAGFKEIGDEGVERESKLISLCDKYGLELVGPNCLGFVNNAINLNATFGQAEHTMGSARFISQSGAIATGMFDWAHLTGVGFSDFVTLGNKTKLDETSILEYWYQLKTSTTINTYLKKTEGVSKYQAVGMYLESISNGQKFIETARKFSVQQPLFVLKPGKSEAAKAASSSHTGALANDDSVLSAALEKCGVIRCDELENFFDLARSFAWENAPKGPRIAIVSNAGGPAVITTDAIAQHNLELAKFSEKTKKLLSSVLPRAANIHNPVDVLGDALSDRYEKAIDAVLKEKTVDALIVILTPQVMTEIEETAEIIGKMSKKFKKPILCSFMGGTLIADGEKVLNKHRIPSFHYPERAVKVYSSMWSWQKNVAVLKKKPGTVLPVDKKFLSAIDKIIGFGGEKRIVLPSQESQYLAALAGLKIPQSFSANNWDQIKKMLEQKNFKWPVVLKISSNKLLHKTEAHGVVTNIMNISELEDSAGKLFQSFINLNDEHAELEVQEQVLDGLEVIVGMKRDPSFGPVIMIGAGGIFTELLADKNLLIPPLLDSEITQKIRSSKVGKLISGFRGGKKYSESALVKLVQTVVAVSVASPKISEMEINPVILTETEAVAVDTKFIFN